MITEEAIKILDNCRIKADCARDETLPAEAEKERDDYIEACTMAIEALKKQIPKKPKEKVYLQTAELYVGKCPNCESGMNSKMNYCDNCGQRLDWSEGNDG